MLHFASDGLHSRVSARSHTFSDDRIAAARFTISRSRSEGAISSKSTSNSIALPEAVERMIGNHPSALLRTPLPSESISVSIGTGPSEYTIFPAHTALGSEWLRHFPVVTDFAVLIVTVGVSSSSRPHEP